MPERYVIVVASMGPRQLSRGISSSTWRAPEGVTASMGPRQLSRGIRAGLENRGPVILASMGPRQLSRGITDVGTDGGSRITGFNGATAIEPWNRHHGVRIRAALPASMGPRQLSRGIQHPGYGLISFTGLQWGHGN